MIKELATLARRLAEVERRLASVNRQGKVSVVDPAEGLVRLDLGDGMLSPWVPYVQTAGALKVHSPPSVGQMMAVSTIGGDTEQGFAVPLSFGGDNASPSTAGDEHMLTFGSVTVLLEGDGVTVVVGGSSLTITSAGIALTAPRIDIN